MRRIGLVLALASLSSIAACRDARDAPPTAEAADTGDGQLAEQRDALARLEHRLSLVRDAKQIKRLQRAYGYYVDEGMWDEAAELFAADGTIEIGLDGVYVGRQRVREYLYALGGGRRGLARGRLNEHFQLMPVITVAPDGLSARGRWRALIMAGELGRSAFWGEGPYENEYVKEGGVWKLSALHWFQSIVIPYDEGWQASPDANGGKWVSAQFPPDRPPSVEYPTWPRTYLPPFHFPNPVVGAVPYDPTAALAIVDFGSATPGEIAARLGVLAEDVGVLEDHNAIERLQRTFGFYVDKQLWTQAADLFAADGTIEIGNSGVYTGKARVLDYLRSGGPEFPQPGRLHDQMQLQPIVDVAPDRRSAKARWHLFAQDAEHGAYARWSTGVYENEYVNDRGVWKIANLRQFDTMITPYADGWGKTALPGPQASTTLPPDQPPGAPHETYPEVFVAPFHYANPADAQPGPAGAAAEHTPSVAATQIDAALAELEIRIGRLEDIEQLERLNAIYGYYLARNQWDDFAGLFASNGTIEIAMRGIYVGPESVRRSMSLYGEPGIQDGLLHNHMQYQPVITLAEDRMSARMRSRAFSIMGQYGGYAMWMGGVYENVYVREDGIWKIGSDQVFNTYFAPYAIGWQELAPRPPPQASATNPPDLPPSHPFEMYPAAFLPPFHYSNPVTGRAVTWPGH